MTSGQHKAVDINDLVYFQSLNRLQDWHRNLNSCGPKQRTSFFENSREEHSCQHTAELRRGDTRTKNTPQPSASGHSCSGLCRSFYTGNITALQLCPVHARTHTQLHTKEEMETDSSIFSLASVRRTNAATLRTCIAPISNVTFDSKKKGGDYKCSTLDLAGSVERYHIELHGYFVFGFLGILAVACRA